MLWSGLSILNLGEPVSPDVRDVEFLKRSFTLCRLEWSFATGAERRQLEREHAHLFDRLTTLDPEIRWGAKLN